METTRINNYSFSKPLTSNNSGFSKWGIGLRGGQKYFVKEFLSPVYPAEDSIFTEEKKQGRIRLCQSYVEDKTALYSAIREAADGHVVIVEQFFRVGAKFYISTKAITDPVMSVSDIARRCSFADRLRLCCAIAHAMARIHEKGIVHADIKADNILVVRKTGLQANIIDFDSSFFESKSPKLGEELNGDLVYLSPEGYLHIADVESNLSCKMDVFALGLLFHQYLTGSLPGFDSAEYQYAYESVLDDHPLNVNDIMNGDCRRIIEQMLSRRPEDRPDMSTVFASFNSILLQMLNRSTPEKVTKGISDFDFFFQPGGDLSEW